MQLTKEKRGECSILLVHGRLDGTTSPKFETEVLGWLSTGGKSFVLDMAGISFMSSAALRVLLSMAKRVGRTGGKVVLSSPNAVVSEVFEISNFSAMFTICQTLEEGVTAATEGRAASTATAPSPAAATEAAPKPVPAPVPVPPAAPPAPAPPAAAAKPEIPPAAPMPPPSPAPAPSAPTVPPPSPESVTPTSPAEPSPVPPAPPTVPMPASPTPVVPTAAAATPPPVAPATPAPAPVAPAPVPAEPKPAPTTPPSSVASTPTPAPASAVNRAGPRKLELVVGTHVVECRDGDVIGSEGTVATHLFKSAASLQPRHILIGKGPDSWFVMIPRNVQVTTHLDDAVLTPGVRQNLSNEHRIAVGDFTFSLRLSEAPERSVNESFFKRLFKLLNIG